MLRAAKLLPLSSRRSRLAWGVFLGLGLIIAAGCKDAPATESPEVPAPAEPGAPGLDEGAATANDDSAALPDRDPVLARRLVREEGAVLLDVRSQAEFDEGHVDGAVLIPHDELEDRLAEVAELAGGDNHKAIVVYCRSGGRATQAKEVLTGAGYDQVTNLGGFTDWCEDCAD